MLDDLLDLFERDKKSTSASSAKPGLRSRLSSLLGGDDRDDRPAPDRERRRFDDRHDDDDRDDDRRSTRKHSRERELFDFGD